MTQIVGSLTIIAVGIICATFCNWWAEPWYIPFRFAASILCAGIMVWGLVSLSVIFLPIWAVVILSILALLISLLTTLMILVAWIPPKLRHPPPSPESRTA